MAVAKNIFLSAFLVGIGATAMHYGPAFASFVRQSSPQGPAWFSKLIHAGKPTTQPAKLDDAVDTWIVKQSTLQVTFNETGKLRAIQSYPVVPGLHQWLKISYLVPDGTTVKKDDIIASFDKKTFEDLLFTKKGELEQAERALSGNKALLEIAKSTGKTSIAQAESKLEEAQVAYRTYIELDGPKRLSELEKGTTEAKSKLGESTKLVSDAQAKIDEGIFSEEDQKKELLNQLTNAKETLTTYQRQVDAFKLQRKIFRTYEYPQSLKTKRSAAESAKMDVEKAKVTGENDVNQKTSDVAKVEDQIKHLHREIEQSTETLTKCDLRAPIAGLCVYGDPSGEYRGYSNDIKVGGEWFGGQVLMTIPDLTKFEIDIDVAEDYVGKIKVGVPVEVTFDAIPNLKVAGKLKDIAKMGKARVDYDPGSPRVFRTQVSMDSYDERMVSGMTGKVQIIADQVKDALTVPIDSVATQSGKPFVLVRTGPALEGLERRDITLGRSNNSLIEVVEGLHAGDRVALGAGASSAGSGSAAGGDVASMK